jgi:DegV family protein with EDD domain
MIHLIADTTSSISVTQAKELGIAYLPQIIIFGSQSYRDDNEIDTATFLKRLRSSTNLPQTAAPPPALYTPIYQKLGTKGNTLVVLCPSSDVSGTYRSATVAAADFPNADIRIIDTRTIASGLGSIVLQAVEWMKEGQDANTLIENVQDMARRARTYFLVDTLEYLYKGGRIGGAKMLFGSILQVKPILMLKDGHTEPAETQRTKRRALARLKELVAENFPHNYPAHLTVSHADAEDEAQKLAEELKTELGLSEVPVYELPPAIIVHAGPGVLTASFFMDTPA